MATGNEKLIFLIIGLIVVVIALTGLAIGVVLLSRHFIPVTPVVPSGGGDTPPSGGGSTPPSGGGGTPPSGGGGTPPSGGGGTPQVCKTSSISQNSSIVIIESISDNKLLQTFQFTNTSSNADANGYLYATIDASAWLKGDGSPATRAFSDCRTMDGVHVGTTVSNPLKYSFGDGVSNNIIIYVSISFRILSFSAGDVIFKNDAPVGVGLIINSKSVSNVLVPIVSAVSTAIEYPISAFQLTMVNQNSTIPPISSTISLNPNTTVQLVLVLQTAVSKNISIVGLIESVEFAVAVST